MTRSSPSIRWAAAALAAMLGAPAGALAQASNREAAAPVGGLVAPPALLTSPGPGTAAAPQPSGPNTLQPPPGGARAGAVVLVRGELTAAQAGRAVTLELLDRRHGWTAVGTGKADSAGHFVVAWRPKRTGRFTLRASAGKAGPAPAGLTAPIEVYRSVVATIFGPGSYGTRTACGEMLTPDLVGVAHLTLPCGTMVDIAYGSQTISVPVVDRGPFVSGVAYDLTTATAAELGVSDTVRIGALPLSTGKPAAP